MKLFWSIVLFPFRLIASTLSLVLKSLASVINVFAVLAQFGFAVLSIFSLYTFVQGFTTGGPEWAHLVVAFIWALLAGFTRAIPEVLFIVCGFLDAVGLRAMFN